jgi:hypothetical protein
MDQEKMDVMDGMDNTGGIAGNTRDEYHQTI